MGLSHTVSGNIASFRTPSRVPIESLKFHFLPKQAAGTPTPENPIPIEGWTGFDWHQEGKNLIDKTELTGTDKVWWKGSIVLGYPDHCVTPLIAVKPGATYYLYRISTNSSGQSGQGYVCYFGKGGRSEYLGQENWQDRGVGNPHTVPDNAYYIGITVGTGHKDTAYLQFVGQETQYTPFVGVKSIPVTFPDGQTIYGGYYDPIVGELVSEYGMDIYDGVIKKITTMNFRVSDRFYALIGETRCQYGNNGYVISNMLKTQYNHGENICYQRPSEAGYLMDFGRTTICDLSLADYDALSNAEQTALANAYLADLYQNGTPLVIVYKFATPIHIPVTPQQLTAYLDHNNFWSDANDITEVTYAVTESKDILATRKMAAMFENGHHRVVNWNQLVKDSNFTGNTVDGSKWIAANSNKGSVSLENNIGTWTCTEAPSQYYQTGFTWAGGNASNYNYLAIPWNHKILVKVKAYCSVACKVRLFTLVGSGAHVWAYNQNILVDTWTDIIGFIPNRNENPTGEDDGFIKRFKPCIAGLNNISEIAVGTVFKIKDAMMVDLTQMFGLGNEPQTVAEFERICAINGIDLTTYQPYDAGSDRWLIVP